MSLDLYSAAMEWQRTLDEVRMVLRQHEAFEQGPR